jgi:hypothetical protein
VPPGALVPHPVAQEIRSRVYLWLRRCPVCQQPRLYRAERATCSHSCGQTRGHFKRPRQFYRRLSAAGVAAREARREARILRAIAGLTPREVWAKAYDAGYQARDAQIRRAARRKVAA